MHPSTSLSVPCPICRTEYQIVPRTPRDLAMSPMTWRQLLRWTNTDRELLQRHCRYLLLVAPLLASTALAWKWMYGYWDDLWNPGLTRTPRRLRWVRTGYAYQPPALCTYRRRRAACPQGPTYSTYWVCVPASGVGYVPRTVAPQVPARRVSALGLSASVANLRRLGLGLGLTLT